MPDQARVTLSANRALWGAVFPQLRKVIASIDEASCHVKFFVDGEISDDDRESLSVAATEILADLPSSFRFHDVIERIDWPARIEVRPPWFLVFLRKEAEG